jgi:hypothetical protein
MPVQLLYESSYREKILNGSITEKYHEIRIIGIFCFSNVVEMSHHFLSWNRLHVSHFKPFQA